MIDSYFRNKIFIDPVSGCWLWKLGKYKNGYGKASLPGYSRLAHRLSYTLHKADIPGKLLVCHKCDVRHCVNPDHLFLGDHKSNAADMMAKGRDDFASFWTKRDACSKGHEYTEDNIYRYSGTGQARLCRTCRRENVKKGRKRKINGEPPRKRSDRKSPLLAKKP